MISILAHFVFATTLMNSPGLVVSSSLGIVQEPEIHFAVASKLTLAEAMDAYCKTTGIRVMANGNVQNSLSEIVLTGFSETPAMSAAELVMFVEGALVQNGYFMQKAAGEQTYWVVRANDHGHQLSWSYVASQDLTYMRQHPAVLVATMLSVENMDTRALSVSLRSLMPQRWQGIYNAGSTAGIALKGTGSEVADMIEMLQGLEGKEAVRLSNVVSLEVSNEETVAGQLSDGDQEETPELVGSDDSPQIASAASAVVLQAHIFEIKAANATDIMNTTEQLWKDRVRTATSSGKSSQARYTRFYRSDDDRRILVRAVAAEHDLIRKDLELATQLHSKEG